MRGGRVGEGGGVGGYGAARVKVEVVFDGYVVVFWCLVVGGTEGVDLVMGLER